MDKGPARMATTESVSIEEMVSSADLSIWSLVAQADLVVQVVMIGLAVSSIWCWAIIFDKVKYFRRLRQQAEEFEEAFWSGGSLEELYGRVGDTPEHHLAALCVVAMREFVGLFGTVWGIMNSFQAIAMTKNTSLAVVAPGIAEALLATALGLVAAIPAVVAYNKLSSDLGRYASRLESFAGEFTALLSRQLGEGVK